MLVLLDKMPEDSEFKRVAERNGQWPGWKQMLAELTNESYRMRSSFQAANSRDGEAGFETAPFEFRDPVIRAARAEVEMTQAEAQEAAQKRFDAELGL